MATQTTAPASAPQHKEVEHFSEAERAAWLKDGTLPPLEEDSSLEADASAASKPASKSGNEDGGKESGSGPGKKARDDDKNWRALETERDTLKAAREAAENELKEWREGKRKPDEKKADEKPKLLEMPARPKMKEFMIDGALDSEKYETALDKYETDKTAYVNQQTMLRTRDAEMTRIIATQSEQLKTKYGDKASGLDVKKTMDALGATSRDAPAFFMFLNDSEYFTDLLYVLGTDPKLEELLTEAKDPKTMTRAIRKLVLLEDGVKRELAKSAKKEEEPKRELSKAGKPPLEAAGAGTAPADDGTPDAAWRRKDLSPEERGELYRDRKNKEERDKRKKKLN